LYFVNINLGAIGFDGMKKGLREQAERRIKLVKLVAKQ